MVRNLFLTWIIICLAALTEAECGILRSYNVHGSRNGDLYISDSLVYKGGNVLYDEKQQIELVIDPDNFTIDVVQTAE